MLLLHNANLRIILVKDNENNVNNNKCDITDGEIHQELDVEFDNLFTSSHVMILSMSLFIGIGIM